MCDHLDSGMEQIRLNSSCLIRYHYKPCRISYLKCKVFHWRDEDSRNLKEGDGEPDLYCEPLDKLN